VAGILIDTDFTAADTARIKEVAAELPPEWQIEVAHHAGTGAFYVRIHGRSPVGWKTILPSEGVEEVIRLLQGLRTP